MKKLFAIMIIAFVAYGPLHLNNEYLRTSHFDRVTITQEQNISALADKYTVNPQDKEKLVEAICEINDLSADASIPVGRSLQIPLLTTPVETQVAQNP